MLTRFLANVYVWDGTHRGEAAKLARMQLLVAFWPGTRREAEWESLGANKLHGLQRTSEDEDKVVSFHGMLIGLTQSHLEDLPSSFWDNQLKQASSAKLEAA